MRAVNPYIEDFVQIAELSDVRDDVSFVINPDARPREDHSRIHGLNLHEVAVLTSEKALSSDIVIQRRSGTISLIADTHRSFDPLHFVLLFPEGTAGWHLKIPQRLVANCVLSFQTRLNGYC